MLRLAVLSDLLEERWYSMDLMSEMLIENADVLTDVSTERVQPSLPTPLGRLAVSNGNSPLQRWSRKLALGVGRYAMYPVEVLRKRQRFDWFHVADHSYSHLVLELPRGRSGVYCHDIDAFRPLLDESRATFPHRALSRTLLAGLRRARVVFHSTLAARDDILAHRLVPSERLVHAPHGVASEFGPDTTAEDGALVGRPPFVLHVGSLIPRKNPRFLAELLVALCTARPELEVVRIGPRFDLEQEDLLSRAGVLGRVRRHQDVTRAELASYYRAASALLLPSTAEGFGLPVIEALACGTPVVASNIPALAQVGKEGAVLCPVGDLVAWKDAVIAVLDGRGPGRETCLRVASDYTWRAHAKTILGTYRELSKSTVS
jgi:glycosyltransferase involved in cell wall biosynthesis